MKTKKILTIGLTSALTVLTACNNTDLADNPLLKESTLPYGAPDFSQISPAHYLPALEAGIAQQRENIERIVNNPDAPTFENTIVAFEESDLLLDRVSRIFFALSNADKTPEIGETEKRVTPLLTDLEN